VGRIVGDLKQHQQLDNTLILFLSDNGACWEWDPLGFDVTSSPKNILHTGEDLQRVGGPGSYISYGSAWANAGNTPWRLYKHFSHEGGIRTPLIIHWPAQVKAHGELRTQPGHIIDVMPTLAEVSGARYPEERNGVKVQPMEGRSLLPALKNQGIDRAAPFFFEHEGSRAVRDGKWKLVSLTGDAWELYDLESDPTETRDLSSTQAEKVRSMATLWEEWARRCHVEIENPDAMSKGKANPATPMIANRPLNIRCEVETLSRNGVIVAQGGRQNGYALHLEGGHPVFSVRLAGQLFTAKANIAPAGKFTLVARLEKDGTLHLAINGREAATGKAAGLIPTQPQDELSVGEDARTAVGDYQPPHPLAGKIENLKITTE
jgi:arylsulfatase